FPPTAITFPPTARDLPTHRPPAEANRPAGSRHPGARACHRRPVAGATTGSVRPLRYLWDRFGCSAASRRSGRLDPHRSRGGGRLGDLGGRSVPPVGGIDRTSGGTRVLRGRGCDRGPGGGDATDIGADLRTRPGAGIG